MPTSQQPIRSGVSRKQTRRNFLKRSAAASAALGFSAPAILRGKNLNEKLDIAVVGCGGRGAANMRSLESQNIVALCDVNENNLAFASQRHPNASKFTDFRQMYEHAGQFDAVAVSTCEHSHALATLPALQLGKHVYCEKPLTYNIWEARVIRQQAARANVATQMGTQIHASDNYRRVVELVQSGAIGSVSEVHVWVARAWGWHASRAEAEQHGDRFFVQDRPKKPQNPPAGLNWDLWLGGAPKRAFHEAYFPGPKWYRWWDFGNGTMSDLGSHWIDLPFWALKLQYPMTVQATGPKVHPEIAPASMQVTYEYPRRGDLGEVKLTWYQGTHKPAILSRGDVPSWGSGVLFIGDKGMLLSDYRKHVLLPENKFADFQKPEPFIAKSIGHHAEWVHACKTGAPTTCNFEYAGWLTEANHLGNVAFRVGEKLNWDPVGLKATNAPQADQFIRRDYRPGWNLG